MWCKHCGPDFPLRVEMREEYGVNPGGTFSLSEQQMKVGAVKRERPYAVCDNCRRESRGEPA